MNDYMDPRNWDKEEVQACKYWSAGAVVTLVLFYFAIWIFY